MGVGGLKSLPLCPRISLTAARSQPFTEGLLRCYLPELHWSRDLDFSTARPARTTDASDFGGEEGPSGLPQPSKESHFKETLTHSRSQDFDPYPLPTAEASSGRPLPRIPGSSAPFSPCLEPHIAHLSYSQGPATTHAPFQPILHCPQAERLCPFLQEAGSGAPSFFHNPPLTTHC